MKKALLITAFILQGCNLPWPPIPGPEPTPTIAIIPVSTPVPTIAPTVPPSPSSAPVPTAMPTEAPDTGKITCSGTQKAPDGSGGFLWKNGDTTKKLAVVLPGEFKKADRVTVFGPNGKAENLQWAGYGNPDEHGLRQHWRGSRPTTGYQGKVEAFTGTSACVWVFKNLPRVD